MASWKSMATATWALTKSTLPSAKAFVDLRRPTAPEEQELGPEPVGLELAQECLVLGCELDGDARKLRRDPLQLCDLLRRGTDIVLADLDEGLGEADDEGIRLSIGTLMVMAKHGLEPLRLDQIGERNDLLDRHAAFDEHRSGKSEMRLLLLNRACGERPARGVRPLIERIGIARMAR